MLFLKAFSGSLGTLEKLQTGPGYENPPQPDQVDRECQSETRPQASIHIFQFSHLDSHLLLFGETHLGLGQIQGKGVSVLGGDAEGMAFIERRNHIHRDPLLPNILVSGIPGVQDRRLWFGTVIEDNEQQRGKVGDGVEAPWGPTGEGRCAGARTCESGSINQNAKVCPSISCVLLSWRAPS